MTAADHAVRMTLAAARAADDKFAQNIVAFDVSDQLAITDVFLVCSAPTDRQVGAIVDEIQRRLREEFDLRPLRREGERDNQWVLLDYFDIVVHVQDNEQRTFYDLERLWKDCPQIPLPGVGEPGGDSAGAGAAAVAGDHDGHDGADGPDGADEAAGSGN